MFTASFVSNTMSANGQTSKDANPRRTSATGRSVKDFDNEASLLEAMKRGLDTATSINWPEEKIPCHVEKEENLEGVCKPETEEMEWVLADNDPLNFETNTLADEMHRLQVLNSFYLLDDESHDIGLDTLTAMGSRIFDVPICMVTLLDLGRVWVASHQGLPMPNTREFCRKNSLCSYATMRSINVFVVPDTSKDRRFNQNPEVACSLHLRFYAGAVLLSPEGYRLGNYCIVDSKPRPQGLSEKEQATLKDFAAMTVRTLVDCRYKNYTRVKREQMITHAAHDLMTPLTGLQLSLSMLQNETESNKSMSKNAIESITTADICSDVIARICRNSFAELRETDILIKKTPEAVSHSKARLSDVVDCIHKIMSPIRKIVPLVISSSKTPPDLIVHDDLVVFRAALNFVSTACSRTKIGSVRLNIHTLDDKLIFECRDTAPDVSARDSLIIFKSESSKGLQDASLGSLHIAASLIASVGGKSGFQPRDVSDGEVLYAGDRHHAGSIVWFSIPLGAQSPRGAATTVVVQESTGIGTDEIVITDTPTRDAQSLLQSSTGSHGKEKRLIPTGITCRSIRRERILDRVVAGSKFTDKTKSSAQTATGAKVRLKKALVIDDCLVVRKGMGRALSKLGCEVTLAENGMEGLQELKKTIFDFSLCDFFMPVMDGLDCVREYRQWEKRHRPWFRQYIVGISAHAGNKDVGLGSELGMDDFKAKPVVVNALKELVESEVVIRKSQQLDKFDSAPASRGTLLMDDAGIDQKRGESSVTLPVCLIVTPDIVDSAGQVLERNSWKYDVTRDHKSAMTSLRLRNYEAVLFDEDLEGASGFVTDFRAWEAKHRVKRQTNIFFLSSICETASSGDEALLVQPPSGFDGAIRKQILWNDFENLMRRNKDASYSSLNYIISR